MAQGAQSGPGKSPTPFHRQQFKPLLPGRLVSLVSCFHESWRQILTSEHHPSSDWGAGVNYNFSFLLLPHMSGTQWGLLLLQPICFKAQRCSSADLGSNVVIWVSAASLQLKAVWIFSPFHIILCKPKRWLCGKNHNLPFKSYFRQLLLWQMSAVPFLQWVFSNQSYPIWYYSELECT